MTDVMFPEGIKIPEDESALSTMMRYFLSDQITRPLNSIIQEDTSPIGYARFYARTSTTSLFEKYGTAVSAINQTIPKKIQGAWVYEHILFMCSVYRISELFGDYAEDMIKLNKDAHPVSLLIDDAHSPESAYVGLCNYKRYAYSFFGEDHISGDIDNIGLLRRAASAVGNADEANWILHSPVWCDTLSSNRNHLIVLRGFLYIILISQRASDDFLKGQYGIERHELLSDIETFIDFRESDSITRRHIVKFLESVEHYSLEVPHSAVFHALYSANHTVFSKLCEPLLESVKQANNSKTTELNRYDWDYLRSLGKEYSPEIIIDTPIEPLAFVNTLFETQFQNIYDNILIPTFEQKGRTLPKTPVKNRKWLNGAMRDTLYLSLIEHRALRLFEMDENQARDMVMDKAHILLLMADNKHWILGFSLVEELLLHHTAKVIDNLSEREAETLSLLMWAWGKLSINKPNYMSKAWKSILNEQKYCASMRSFMFSIIDLIRLPQGADFVKHTGVDRDTFFAGVENFCEYITGDPTEEEIAELFSIMPMIRVTAFVDTKDQILWSAPFAMVVTHCQQQG